ncbi:MAG: VWA domain-containing protein [Myxococcales bacterium]|nr:VWA domain-containing protein [Myxococcales bacterium]
MRLEYALCALVLAAAACGGGDGDTTDGRGPSGPSTGGQPAAGEPGDGSGPASSGMFGNTNATAPNMMALANGGTLADGAVADDCEVGQLCVSDNPDEDDCGTLRLESDIEVTREPGNLLIIFDQSGSMDQPWGNGGSKLQAAQTALVNAITPLQDDLTVGAIFFPTYDCPLLLVPPVGGAVAPIDGPGQIPFQAGPTFLGAWQQHWAAGRMNTGLGTPMQEAFDRADVAIQNATLTGNLAIIAFTDGEPNCFADPNQSGPTMLEPDRAASWLGSQMIKTYVVGLPGAVGVQLLNDVAVAGGTMQYIVPDDPAQLEAVLSQVVSETVTAGFNSCSITLNPAADVPDKLLMIVEETGIVGEQQVPRDFGWSISDNGENVEITGALCDDAMNGRFTSITFEFACPEAPPPPPIKPPE